MSVPGTQTHAGGVAIRAPRSVSLAPMTWGGAGSASSEIEPDMTGTRKCGLSPAGPRPRHSAMSGWDEQVPGSAPGALAYHWTREVPVGKGIEQVPGGAPGCGASSSARELLGGEGIEPALEGGSRAIASGAIAPGAIAPGASPSGAVPDLPLDCIAAILARCTPRQICRLSLVSTAWAEAGASDQAWARWLPQESRVSMGETFLGAKGCSNARSLISASLKGLRSRDGGCLLVADPSTGLLRLHVSAAHSMQDRGPAAYSWQKSGGVPGASFDPCGFLATRHGMRLTWHIQPGVLLPTGTYTLSWRLGSLVNPPTSACHVSAQPETPDEPAAKLACTVEMESGNPSSAGQESAGHGADQGGAPRALGRAPGAGVESRAEAAPGPGMAVSAGVASRAGVAAEVARGVAPGPGGAESGAMRAIMEFRVKGDGGTGPGSDELSPRGAGGEAEGAGSLPPVRPFHTCRVHGALLPLQGTPRGGLERRADVAPGSQSEAALRRSISTPVRHGANEGLVATNSANESALDEASAPCLQLGWPRPASSVGRDQSQQRWGDGWSPRRPSFGRDRSLGSDQRGLGISGRDQSGLGTSRRDQSGLGTSSRDHSGLGSSSRNQSGLGTINRDQPGLSLLRAVQSSRSPTSTDQSGPSMPSRGFPLQNPAAPTMSLRRTASVWDTPCRSSPIAPSRKLPGALWHSHSAREAWLLGQSESESRKGPMRRSPSARETPGSPSVYRRVSQALLASSGLCTCQQAWKVQRQKEEVLRALSQVEVVQWGMLEIGEVTIPAPTAAPRPAIGAANESRMKYSANGDGENKGVPKGPSPGSPDSEPRSAESALERRKAVAVGGAGEQLGRGGSGVEGGVGAIDKRCGNLDMRVRLEEAEGNQVESQVYVDAIVISQTLD